ncbi:MAG: metal-dependent transcriptional regulator [Bacteroidota bacterium]|nr:metal-dependent transcriptional regulator [Bacteroidota bacterium]
MNTKSEEDYLKCLYHLQQGKKNVSTNEIANYLSMKPSSVSDMLKKLAEKKLVYYLKYKGSSLTKKGELIALSVIRKHRLWETFLVNKLGFSWSKVHNIAEQLEHVNSEELIDKLDHFLAYPQIDPHGDPIPQKNGTIAELNQKLLSELKRGEEGIITGIKKGTPSLLNFLDQKNIKLGDQIQLISILEFDQSAEVIIHEKAINLSEKICSNLLIETLND